MAKHATLGPSAAARWIACPASVEMSTKVPPQQSSPYAVEGTLAHELGEIQAGYELGIITTEEYAAQRKSWENKMMAEYPKDWTDKMLEMSGHIEKYVTLILERMETIAAPTVFLEQRVDTGVERSWGTSDVVIIGADTIEIIDLKYGMGVAVDPVANPQLMLYGLGAARKFESIVDPETVRMTVFQPRIFHSDTWEVGYKYLTTWRDEVVKPAAKQALAMDGTAPFGPSLSACRFCPAAGVCRPRMDKVLQEDFAADPTLISDEDLAALLHRLPEIKSFVEAAHAAALHRVYSEGAVVPGWKVVRSSGRRVINDPAVAAQTLIDLGYAPEDVAEFKIKSITALEKLLGKKTFSAALGDFISKTEGVPSLAPETDKRPAISPQSEAAKDFAE